MITPPLALDKEQAKRLLGYIQEYRRYTLTQPPSPERNASQRLFQTLQGRLIVESERGHQTVFSFALSNEEVRALKDMIRYFSVLMAQEEPKTQQLHSMLVDLAFWKRVFEQRYPSEPKKHFTKSLAESQEQRR